MAVAFENVKGSITGVAGADLTGKRYLFLKYDTNGNVVVAGAGERAIGTIRDNDIASGDTAQVQHEGYAYIFLGATLSAGAEVMSDANGKAVAYDPATAANRPAGVLAVGGASGALATVLLNV